MQTRNGNHASMLFLQHNPANIFSDLLSLNILITNVRTKLYLLLVALAGEWRRALGTLTMALLSILECGLKMCT